MAILDAFPVYVKPKTWIWAAPLALVLVVVAGSRITRFYADPTSSADLSVGYPAISGSSWLSAAPVFPKSVPDSRFLPAESSVLSLLYPRDGHFVYLARRGETFSSIAAKLGVGSAALQKANPKIKRINAGQEIIIPAGN